MKLPDLTAATEAGVREWNGTPDPIKAAATAAKLKYATVDLNGVGGKTELLSALGKGLKLPEHFGDNWDALADCLEDSDWLGGHGMAIVLRHANQYGKSYRTDWETLSEILGEAAEYWQERHKPFWVFVA
ncbi:MAG TPA: barstar family protein [Casimicrobiaceae bacterium]|jgi:RNAse (barnase) inhibitor barstar|nr:barstar family protein [Casimicrobiaceae bacterium]